MKNLPSSQAQIGNVSSFRDLVATTFQGEINALCWQRKLVGDFAEIVGKVNVKKNISVLGVEELMAMHLSAQGQIARDILVKDLELLTAQGAAPTLNVIKHYERDDSFFPTDVYSWHVDRCFVPTDTFLCTYHGAPSEILPNSEGKQKILIPKLRTQLQEVYDGPSAGFDAFLSEYFFDLHYEANAHASPINLGVGNLWKLAVDHPKSKVLPCLHRAPLENDGKARLLLIC